MGVVYKLKPEIKEFILREKELNPALSCRKFIPLIEKKFHIRLSKSHINSIIKSAGLSNRVGRTPKLKRRIELEGLGVFLLKIVENLIGGLDYLAKVTKIELPYLEAFIYLYLFEQERIKDLRWQKIIAEGFNSKKFFSYLNDLQNITIKEPYIKEDFFHLFKEVLGVKLTFLDGKSFYIDGNFFSLWSSLNIPWDFSVTYNEIKTYIDNFIQKPYLILFTSPGYEIIPQEWFEFLLRLSYANNKIQKFTLLDLQAKEIETFYLEEPQNPLVILGLWPWQYAQSRKIEQLNDFIPFYFEGLKKEFLIAEARVILTQASINKAVKLRGIILKSKQESQIELFILTNILENSLPQITNLYLNAWPNLKEGFSDFSKRIEFFTYHIDAHKVIPKEALIFACENPLTFFLKEYLFFLDKFLRWYFFPLEYRRLDFQVMKENFYNLKGKIKREKGSLYLIFNPPQDFSYLKDLKVACGRINERKIFLEKRRVWLEIA